MTSGSSASYPLGHRRPGSPKIEFLWWKECPSWERALHDLRKEIAARGLDPEAIEVREIETEADSKREGFVGSPTIRIDGADISPPEPAEEVGLNCRLYRRRDGRFSPLPDPEDVRAALDRATAG